MIEEKTRTVCFFKNTCHHCHNDIEYPLLGDFSYGEVIFQTIDAQHFALAVLIDNKTFAFIRDSLKTLKDKKADPQHILARVADPLSGFEFTNHILCPICRHKQRNFIDNFRKRLVEIPVGTWHAFESLSEENRFQLVSEIITGKI
jgi:hypothetical protein